VIRDLFLKPVSWTAAVWVLGQCVAFFVIVGVLAFGSVALATWLFAKMTGRLPERDQILQDNVAVAILFAFVIVGVTPDEVTVVGGDTLGISQGVQS
jgi:hypothetical protein